MIPWLNGGQNNRPLTRNQPSSCRFFFFGILEVLTISLRLERWPYSQAGSSLGKGSMKQCEECGSTYKAVYARKKQYLCARHTSQITGTAKSFDRHRSAASARPP